MYQQNQTYEKHYDGQPLYGQSATTAIPVSSTADSSQLYSTDNSYSHSVGGLHIQSKARVPWSTGLCDCTSDVKNCKYALNSSSMMARVLTRSRYGWLVCFLFDYGASVILIILIIVAGCITCWCPCITFGQVAEIVDKGSTCKKLYWFLKLDFWVVNYEYQIFIILNKNGISDCELYIMALDSDRCWAGNWQQHWNCNCDYI